MTTRAAAEGAGPGGPDVLRAALDALRDMTGAYHKECHHEGSYRRCQKPRCLNARLLLDGRRSEYESADVGVFDKP